MKKIKIPLFGAILLVTIIPIIINLTMYIPFSITVDSLSQSDWLSFFGSYMGGVLGGLGTLIAVFLTITHYENENLNSKKRVENSFEIAKIDKIVQFLKNRDVISTSDYENNMKLIDLTEDIKRYNSLVSDFSAYFTNIAIGIFINLFFIQNNEGDPVDNNLSNFLSLPDEIRDYSFIVGKLALHENCSELIKSHPKIGHIIEKEAGGSYGMWHLFLHEFHDDEYREKQLKEFFEIISSLVIKLEKIKKTLI